MAAQPAKAQISSDGEGAKTLADILLAQGALTSENAEQLKLAEIQTGKSQEEIIKTKKLAGKSHLRLIGICNCESCSKQRKKTPADIGSEN